MSVLGVISEYNPFHKGHSYHLEKSKQLSQAHYSLALMSGSFVQRGEPALVDKWTRANMALASGIDLVIELPFIYAGQRAESFASGAIRLLDRLGLVDFISFGTEANDLEKLGEVAQLLVKEPAGYKKLLREALDLEKSYPAARSWALAQFLEDNSLEALLRSSNNILALEYLRSLAQISSNIQPLAIQRQGASYNSLAQNQAFMSATGIRAALLELDPGPARLDQYIDQDKLDLSLAFKQAHGSFNQLENYSDLIIYTLRFRPLPSPMDSTPDLVQRLVNNSYIYDNIQDLIQATISKNYTRSRIKRVLVNILLGISQEDFKKLDQVGPNYIRVLAANQKGLELLRLIKEKSSLPIITKFANHHRLKDQELESLLAYDKAATDLFYLGLAGKKYNMDYLTPAQIKKP